MESGAEIRFPVADNPRLARGTHQQLNHIEICRSVCTGRNWTKICHFAARSKAITAKKPKPDARHFARRLVNFRRMNFLVTGGEGFIGSHVS